MPCLRPRKAVQVDADLLDTLQSHLDLMQRQLIALKARQAAELHQLQQQHLKLQEKYSTELGELRMASQKMAAAVTGLSGNYEKMAVGMQEAAIREVKLVDTSDPAKTCLASCGDPVCQLDV